MTAIIDYVVGNVHSVETAVRSVGGDPVLTGDPADLDRADEIILPGVGAFGDGVRNLRAAGMDEALRRAAARGTPVLGICLGLQLFFSWSEEGDCAGLGLIPGRVVRFRFPGRTPPVPQMGWNRAVPVSGDFPLFAGLPPEPWFYFAHSYYAVPDDPAAVVCRTDYGGPYASAVAVGSLVGVQFHPEKSGRHGLRALANFLRR